MKFNQNHNDLVIRELKEEEKDIAEVQYNEREGVEGGLKSLGKWVKLPELLIFNNHADDYYGDKAPEFELYWESLISGKETLKTMEYLANKCWELAKEMRWVRELIEYHNLDLDRPSKDISNFVKLTKTNPVACLQLLESGIFFIMDPYFLNALTQPFYHFSRWFVKCRVGEVTQKYRLNISLFLKTGYIFRYDLIEELNRLETICKGGCLFVFKLLSLADEKVGEKLMLHALHIDAVEMIREILKDEEKHVNFLINNCRKSNGKKCINAIDQYIERGGSIKKRNDKLKEQEQIKSLRCSVFTDKQIAKKILKEKILNDSVITKREAIQLLFKEDQEEKIKKFSKEKDEENNGSNNNNDGYIQTEKIKQKQNTKDIGFELLKIIEEENLIVDGNKRFIASKELQDSYQEKTNKEQEEYRERLYERSKKIQVEETSTEKYLKKMGKEVNLHSNNTPKEIMESNNSNSIFKREEVENRILGEILEKHRADLKESNQLDTSKLKENEYKEKEAIIEDEKKLENEKEEKKKKEALDIVFKFVSLNFDDIEIHNSKIVGIITLLESKINLTFDQITTKKLTKLLREMYIDGLRGDLYTLACRGRKYLEMIFQRPKRLHFATVVNAEAWLDDIKSLISNMYQRLSMIMHDRCDEDNEKIIAENLYDIIWMATISKLDYNVKHFEIERALKNEELEEMILARNCYRIIEILEKEDAIHEETVQIIEKIEDPIVLITMSPYLSKCVRMPILKEGPGSVVEKFPTILEMIQRKQLKAPDMKKKVIHLLENFPCLLSIMKSKIIRVKYNIGLELCEFLPNYLIIQAVAERLISSKEALNFAFDREKYDLACGLYFCNLILFEKLSIRSKDKGCLEKLKELKIRAGFDITFDAFASDLSKSTKIDPKEEKPLNIKTKGIYGLIKTNWGVLSHAVKVDEYNNIEGLFVGCFRKHQANLYEIKKN